MGEGKEGVFSVHGWRALMTGQVKRSRRSEKSVGLVSAVGGVGDEERITVREERKTSCEKKATRRNKGQRGMNSEV